MAAFATTILFLILTLIMVSVTLQSSYAWLVMGSTLFLFVTLCSYSSCEKTYWRRTTMHSDSVSTISDGHDNIEGVCIIFRHPPVTVLQLISDFIIAFIKNL